MKLMHISDLHFGMHNQAVITVFLQELARISPDIILISGDLTQRGTAEQYQLFTDFLKKLPGLVLPVPGNHDIPLYPHQFMMRMFYPFKLYKHYVSPTLHVQFENKLVRILGVNSVNPYRVKKGRLATETMELIKSYFSSSFAGFNILFFHHNFDYLEGAHKPLENYKELINYLKESPINMVCAGHSHYANINLLEKMNQQACIFLHAGSLLCTRSRDGLNSYYLLDLTNGVCSIEWRIFQQHSFVTKKCFEIDTFKKFSDIHLL